VFQDSTFAKLPGKNLDYLVAERTDKNNKYRYIDMCFKIFFPAPTATKATLKKK